MTSAYHCASRVSKESHQSFGLDFRAAHLDSMDYEVSNSSETSHEVERRAELEARSADVRANLRVKAMFPFPPSSASIVSLLLSS